MFLAAHSNVQMHFTPTVEIDANSNDTRAVAA
jgi:hypothetical protein